MSAPLLTKHDVAARLSISPRTVLELAARRELACVRLGRCVRFEVVDVEAFRQSRRWPAEAAPTVPTVALPVSLPAPRKNYFG